MNLGELCLEFIHTPGHMADLICVKVKDKLITGDTLFVGKAGSTYNEMDAREEFESLKRSWLFFLVPECDPAIIME